MSFLHNIPSPHLTDTFPTGLSSLLHLNFVVPIADIKVKFNSVSQISFSKNHKKLIQSIIYRKQKFIHSLNIKFPSVVQFSKQVRIIIDPFSNSLVLNTHS